MSPEKTSNKNLNLCSALILTSTSPKNTSKIVLQNSELTAKYQHPLVQIGQKIPEGLDLQMGVPV